MPGVNATASNPTPVTQNNNYMKDLSQKLDEQTQLLIKSISQQMEQSQETMIARQRSHEIQMKLTEQLSAHNEELLLVRQIAHETTLKNLLNTNTGVATTFQTTRSDEDSSMLSNVEEFNQLSRTHNKACNNSEILQAIKSSDGRLPTFYPATKHAISEMTSAKLNMLLVFYSLKTEGTIKDRQIRLLRFITVDSTVNV